MRAVFLLGAALFACGGPHVAPSPKPIDPAPQPVATRPKPVTCAEVGIILRGTVDEAPAGPTKEQVIATACTDDKWPDPVVQCVGGQTRAGSCVDGLTELQKASYGKRLEAWASAHPNESFNKEQTGWEPPPPPRLWTCNDPLGDPATYAPEVTATGDDRTFAVALRKSAVFVQCTTNGWDQEVLRCMQEGPAQPCRAKLAAPAQKALTDRLAEVDALVVKVVDAKKKPQTIDCKKAIATHYSDAAWKGKLADQKPADRNKAITDSRALMTKACVDEKWSDNLRACIVSSGGDACFATVGSSAVRWGFPALALTINTGITECDAMLMRIQAMASCDKAPQQLKDAYQQSSAQMLEMYKTMTPDQRVNAPAQCKQIDEAIEHAGKALGCTL